MLLVAGSDSSLSSLPTVQVMDAAAGAELYTVTLNTSGMLGGARERDGSPGAAFAGGGHWKIGLLWVQAAAAAEGGGLAIFLDGVHSEQGEKCRHCYSTEKYHCKLTERCTVDREDVDHSDEAGKAAVASCIAAHKPRPRHRSPSATFTRGRCPRPNRCECNE